MPNPIVLRVNKLSRICLIGLFLATAPIYLCGQESALSQRAPSGAVQPFAGFDESLTKAADTLLVSVAQTSSPANGETNTERPPIASLTLQDAPRSRSSVGGGLTAAAVRLNLLRPAIEPILRSHDVPAELAAVILVESGSQIAALSPKGARGFWQLMPDTARRYGLRVDDIRDDRLDLFRATDAAAGYLHDLYVQFGDWKLALAAYNTGEANVASAILRAHSQDFDQLANLRILPLETRSYVPRVLAAARFIGPSLAFGDDRRSSSAITVFAVSDH